MSTRARAWLDGRVIPLDEARIPITDHGLLYGDGIFEGIRITAGRVFRLDDHLARFATAARAIGLALPGGSRGRASGGARDRARVRRARGVRAARLHARRRRARRRPDCRAASRACSASSITSGSTTIASATKGSTW